MPTVDLSTPPPPPESLLAGLPRRLTVTLPELRLLAERAGGAPLPFTPEHDDDATDAGSGLASRLGAGDDAGDDGGDDGGAAAYAEVLEGLHDPAESLARRGLLGPDDPSDRSGRTGLAGATGGLEPGLAGAVGLLATPTVALDVDVNVDGVQLRAWHRQGRSAVATLATADGLVFELAWFGTDQWAAELARVASLPADLRRGGSALPAVLDLPYELLDVSGEAFRARRSDVVPVLAATHTGEVLADGRPVPDAQVPGLLGALAQETRGRLRAMVSEVAETHSGAGTVGVTSWLLLADGWHALRPHTSGDVARVEVRRVAPSDLAGSLAPVLAEVSR